MERGLDFKYIGWFSLLFACTCLPRVSGEPSVGCTQNTEWFPERGSRERLEVLDPYFGPVEREFLLFLPSTYNNSAPAPLILDFHGWSEDAEYHIGDSQWDKVGEENGLIVAVPDGIPDVASGIRTWNITTEYSDPYGWRCNPNRTEYGEYECHTSCLEWCRPEYGCTAGTTCYNDLAFAEQLIEYLKDVYCVDTNHVHITGYSNGATFTYRMFSYSQLTLGASGPVSGSPFIGNGQPPQPPRSIIDFHGLDDWTVPQQYDHSPGEGPMGEVRTIMSWDGLYYYYKPEYLDYVADNYTCSAWEDYPTGMEGRMGWTCSIRRNCIDDVEVVKCVGDYGHVYPFNKGPDSLQAPRILWNFFKDHPAQP